MKLFFNRESMLRKYDITVDVINHLQHHICAHYYGELRHGMIGYEIVTPIE